jgi:hypothetical protein
MIGMMLSLILLYVAVSRCTQLAPSGSFCRM